MTGVQTCALPILAGLAQKFDPQRSLTPPPPDIVIDLQMEAPEQGIPPSPSAANAAGTMVPSHPDLPVPDPPRFPDRVPVNLPSSVIRIPIESPAAVAPRDRPSLPAGPGITDATSESPSASPDLRPTNTPPRLLNTRTVRGTFPLIAFPKEALRRGHAGTVRLEWTVNADGSIADLKVTRPSRHPELNDAAMRHVRTQFHFDPPGEQIPYWFEFEFRL